MFRCLVATALVAIAPACLAQEASAADGAPESRPAATDTATATESPRSALGKVMSLLISALEQNAGAPAADPLAGGHLEFQPTSGTAPPARDIQVSAAFQLPPAATAAPAKGATASID